jgi:hypothetical protein
MLEKLGFQQLIEKTLTIKRRTRSMPVFEFILGMILASYVVFSRLNQFRFLKRDPMLTGILEAAELPPQSSFWRLLASLHLGIARRCRVACENECGKRPTPSSRKSPSILTRCTRCSVSRMGACKGYNPKNNGKKSYQPILSFIAQT